MDFLITTFGFILLWAACDVHRPNDKIEIFSKEWFFQLVLMIVGVTLINAYMV